LVNPVLIDSYLSLQDEAAVYVEKNIYKAEEGPELAQTLQESN